MEPARLPGRPGRGGVVTVEARARPLGLAKKGPRTFITKRLAGLEATLAGR